MKGYRLAAMLVLLALFSGCTTLISHEPQGALELRGECRDFVAELDASVREARVEDAASERIPGFPFLRTNRFLAALKTTAMDKEQRGQWLLRMQELDFRARRNEIKALSEERVLALVPGGSSKSGREELLARVESCSREAIRLLNASEALDSKLPGTEDLPDEYWWFMQVLGLYPLAVIPVALMTAKASATVQEAFRADAGDVPVDGELRTFVPAERRSVGRDEVQRIIVESAKNPLGVPLPAASEATMLALAFAPVLVQDIAARRDRFGRVVWRRGGLAIDVDRPSLYYYFSHAFRKGIPILQINYVLWYSGRGGKGTPWFEKGRLDGLTIRISLDREGTPFMSDIMQNCGCYHFFSPIGDEVVQVRSVSGGFDPFVPQWLPEIPQGARLGIRVKAGHHLVQRLMVMGQVTQAIPYELFSYGDLEALPYDGSRTESMFDRSGIAKGSERAEQFLLFSVGIPRLGSMRQRGHHAISFTGREHFDDPHLLDSSFVFK